MDKLQFITHATSNCSYLQSAEIALRGGIRWIQARIKNVNEVEFKKEAVAIKQLCNQYNARFFINDLPQLALLLDADGVHLGKSDMHPDEARKLLGDKKIIGGTANSFQDIQELYDQGIDYIGLGPFRFTQTKQNLSPILGLEGYSHIMESCYTHNIQIPIFAIGGIEKEDVSAILQTGIYGIALSSTIINAKQPVNEASEIVTIVNSFQRN